MPNIITHKIFAEEVLKSMTKHDIRSMIERHPQIFYIGSNGPDFLFFSHIKPWESYKSHALNRLGSAMHAHGINAFYETAIECIRAQKHADIKELMSVYLFGHLCHWALDYPCYEICAYDEDILKAIARIYVPAARKVYHHEVKVHDIRETLNSWYDVQKLLYDPKNIKYPLLKGFETIARKPWAVSGNVVRPLVDERYDVLNEEHAIWKHPCDDTITSNASFIDMFNEAIETAVHVVDKAYGCIEYGADSHTVLELLQDAAYDTGLDGKRDMKYFDIIYD